MAGVNLAGRGPPPYNAVDLHEDDGVAILPGGLGPAVGVPLPARLPRMQGPPHIPRQGHAFGGPAARAPVPGRMPGAALNARKTAQQSKPLKLGRQGKVGILGSVLAKLRSKICYVPDRSLLWMPTETPTDAAQRARFVLRKGDSNKLLALCDERNYVRYCADIRKEMSPAEVTAAVLRAFDGTGTAREHLAGGFR